MPSGRRGPRRDARFQSNAGIRQTALASDRAFCDTRTMSSPSALERLRRWFSGKTSAGAAAPAVPIATPGAHAGGLRQQRAVRREQLFALVRENMIRMGVLSSHYKFKVLTLDPGGEQFIVMVDWQPGAQGADPVFEKQFEAGLQHLLVERLQGFKVKAVYWRGHAEGAASPQARPERADRPVLAVHHQEHVCDAELRDFQAALRQARPGVPPPAAPRTPAAALPQAVTAVQAPGRSAHQAHTTPTEFPDFEPTINTEGQQGTDFGSLSETQYDKLG